MNAVRFLSLQNVIHIHEDSIREEGGIHGIRDEGLLASAVDMPQASFGGQFLHSGLAEMAAAYLFHLCQNHPFLDGNKRTAAFTSVLFLALNGIPDEMLPAEQELEAVTLKIASGQMEKSEAADWMRSVLGQSQGPDE